MRSVLKIVLCVLWLLFSPLQVLAKNVEITNAWALDSLSTTPPAFEGEPAWKKVTLPDHWDIRRPDQSGAVWYRAEFTIDTIDTDRWAIYLPRAVQTAVVYINGIAVGNSGVIETPLKPHSIRPYLFPFTSKLLSKGHNTIAIHLAGFSNNNSGLYPIKVGHIDDLEGDYQTRFHLEVTAPFFASLLMASTFVFALIFWLFKRRELLYLWVSLTGFSGAIMCSYWWLYDIPFSYSAWKTLAYASLGFYAYFVLIFVQQFFRIEQTLLLKLLKPYFFYQFIVIAIMLLSGDENLNVIANLLKIPDALMASYLTWSVWKARHHNNSFTIALIFLTIFLGLALVTKDFYEMMMEPPSSGQLFYYIETFTVFIVVFWLLISRHRSVLNNYQDLSAELQIRVDQRTQQLKTTHDKLLTLEKQKAIDHERQRIMLDLHDGLGGYLVSALSYTEKNLGNDNALHQTLSFAMQDLRLLIDSMDCDEDDLIIILAMFRQRVEPILELNGITLKWQVTNEPRLNHSSSSQSVQIVRILQEAITNIIKHAKATEVVLMIDTASIIVRDNGTGFKDDKQKAKSYGLLNMQQRSRRFGAKLMMKSTENGVEICLSWENH